MSITLKEIRKKDREKRLQNSWTLKERRVELGITQEELRKVLGIQSTGYLTVIESRGISDYVLDSLLMVLESMKSEE